jgi:serine/threonine protein kinase
MDGLADGLENVHICRVKISLTPGGAGNVRILNEGAISVTLSVEEGEQWYGRHGDIKPENVLWFRDDPDIPGEKDVLKLADFGLGRFHGRDTRSKVDPKTIAYSPTYEPPEVWLGTPVSRAYDIWSLGCLYLEFVTWLLMGYEAIDTFADRRLQGTFQSFYDDSFYTITNDLETGAKKADIREGVRDWVQELHIKERCSQFMHDLLDVVIKNMLLVESKSRIDASSLHQTFVRFKDRAREDKDYLLAPRPWPSCIDSVRLKPNTSQRKVRFDEHAVDSSQNLPGKLNKSGTWATVP